MGRLLRRIATTAGATAGGLALLTGTASAHYCYTLQGTDGMKVKGQAWATAAETAEAFAGFLPPGPCAQRVLGHIEDLGEQGALFMGPGLLAGGAVHKGQGPAHMGHLIADIQAFPECASLFEE